MLVAVIVVPAAAFAAVLMVMRVRMLMLMVVIMAMRGFAMAVIVVIMAVVVMIVPTMGVVGAPHWLESRFNRRDRSAQPFKHGADDVIALNENAVGINLGRQVAVAEMPGKLRQVQRIATTHLEQLFLCGFDFHKVAIVEHQLVAIGKEHRFLQVQHDHVAIVEVKKLAAQMPQIVRQFDLAHGRIGGGAGRDVRMDAQHDFPVFRFVLNIQGDRPQEGRTEALTGFS